MPQKAQAQGKPNTSSPLTPTGFSIYSFIALWRLLPSWPSTSLKRIYVRLSSIEYKLLKCKKFQHDFVQNGKR